MPALALLGFGLAFLQRPGVAFTDTRIELSTNPGGFLSHVSSSWSSTVDLGHVQSGQFVGYLFPMGPWYALTHLLGVSTWVAQRLWLGALLTLAAWGVVRLLDELYDRDRHAGHFVAGVVFAVNPYVATFVSRSTVTLLLYAALPWLLVCVHRGLHDPHRWRWPVTFALILTSAGGGVNAAVLFWGLVGAAALALYEAVVLRRDKGALRGYGWRAGLCSALACAWWIVPVYLQEPFFLRFIEQPPTVWATTSVSESLRLLGLWVSYFGFGYGGALPASPVASMYLFSLPVLLSTLLLPVFAFLGLRWRRDWPYAPFFALLAAVAVLSASVGFPPETPLRHALLELYYNVGPLQFLRTTHKAIPLVALALACLAGVFLDSLLTFADGGRLRLAGRALPAWALSPLVVLLLVLFAYPLLRGTAIGRDLAYDKVPDYWRSALADADRSTGSNSRIMVLPGELFGSYRWGTTQDSIAPGLARRPVVIRQINRYANPRSSQLQTAVDDLIQQGRLVPGQLPGLLGLLGVGEVVVASDSRHLVSDALNPAGVAQSLRSQPFGRPAAIYGAWRTYLPDAGRSGPEKRLPDVRRYDLPRVAGAGMVRVHPLTAATVLDGDGDGIAELAAHRLLRNERALFYAGDTTRRRLRQLVDEGARLVFTDTNRRRVIVASRVTENAGPTLGARDPIPRELTSYDLFPKHGSAGQTVAEYSGLRALTTPQGPIFSSYPQNRPYAALDASAVTSWSPNYFLPPSQRYMDIELARPRPMPFVRIYPQADRFGQTLEVAYSVNGGAERTVKLARGWNSIRLAQPALRRLRVRIVSITGPTIIRAAGGIVPALPVRHGIGAPAVFRAGGITGLELPGVRVRESLRLPTDLAAAARGLELSRNDIDILLQRTTANFPYRAGNDAGYPPPSAAVDELDPETGIDRQITLPATRIFSISGWASVSPEANDAAIDLLTGIPSDWRFTSSSRFEGVPGRRASSAFDGDVSSAWIGNLLPGHIPWLAWRAPHPITFNHLRLQPGPAPYLFPSRVRLSIGRRLSTPILKVQPNGEIRLPHPIRSAKLRIDIVSARAPDVQLARIRQLRAVAISEVRVPGLRPVRRPRQGRFTTGCGALTIAAAGVRAVARVSGTVSNLDAGEPLRLRGCNGLGGTLILPAGRTELTAPAGTVMRPDHLHLGSRAPSPAPRPTDSARIIDPGHGTDGRRDAIRLHTTGASWLVLAESYSPGWHASCTDGEREHPLGASVPIDGFANGWRVGPDCHSAQITFTPQRFATVAYLISIVSILTMLALLLRERLTGDSQMPTRLGIVEPDDRVRHYGPGAAIGRAAVVAITVGLLFGVLAGIIAGAGAAALLLTGVSSKRLLTVAVILLVGVSVLYVASPSRNLGGFNFDYAIDHVAEHWLALAAVSLIVVAALIDARAIRRALGTRSARER